MSNCEISMFSMHLKTSVMSGMLNVSDLSWFYVNICGLHLFFVCLKKSYKIWIFQVVRVSRKWNVQETLKISIQLIFLRKFCYLTNICGWQAWNTSSILTISRNSLSRVKIILITNLHHPRPIQSCPKQFVVTTSVLSKNLRLTSLFQKLAIWGSWSVITHLK